MRGCLPSARRTAWPVAHAADERTMKGFITTRDVLLHPMAIIGGFGLRVYARCVGRVLSGRPSTFLECI